MDSLIEWLGLVAAVITILAVVFNIRKPLWRRIERRALLGAIGGSPRAEVVGAVMETEAQGWIRNRLDNLQVGSVDFLVNANKSRHALLVDMVQQRRLPVRLAVQDPRQAFSRQQKETIVRSLLQISALQASGSSAPGDLEIRLYPEQAALRLTLLRSRDSEAICCALGWYLYRDGNRAVPGAKNPTVLALGRDNQLVKHADVEFHKKWATAAPLDVDWLQEYAAAELSVVS